MIKTTETAKYLNLQTELEFTDISRERAAEAILDAVGGVTRYPIGGYDEWTVGAPDGRSWIVLNASRFGDRAPITEVLTPILVWKDLDTLLQVIRALRNAGAKDKRCKSLHADIELENFDAKQIENLLENLV